MHLKKPPITLEKGQKSEILYLNIKRRRKIGVAQLNQCCCGWVASNKAKKIWTVLKNRVIKIWNSTKKTSIFLLMKATCKEKPFFLCTFSIYEHPLELYKDLQRFVVSIGTVLSTRVCIPETISSSFIKVKSSLINEKCFSALMLKCIAPSL